jgi:2-amino-4-hydroxy-6-hydroxymethyldihydropteridine diphosphokinase
MSVLIGLGSNLAPVPYASTIEVLNAAIASLSSNGIVVLRRSRWYRSEPQPASPQPWFTNGVVAVVASIPAIALLETLHRIEHAYGRRRLRRNEPRVLDLDLLAYDDLIVSEPHGLHIPHPRLHERAFVLKPLIDVAPDWRHPALGRIARELLDTLPGDQIAEPL